MSPTMSSRLVIAATTLLLVLLDSSTALSPVEIKGYKMFESESGQEFVAKGIDYMPRPNAGDLNKNSVDFYSEEHRHIWERDIPILQELGVNVIRLYAVDASKNHDAFMCALNAAGIYVVVALASDCPTCAITRDEAPDCYPTGLKVQGQEVINEFAKYSNTLAFSAGNEVNHFTPDNNPEWNGPCEKKFMRDMRAFIHSCKHMRNVPVGLVSADSERDDVSLYYNCASNPDDPFENAEWFGLNTYLHCDGSVHEYEDSGGYKNLTLSFETYQYSIPVLLTEFGCLSKTFPTLLGFEGQRSFDQAKWMLEEKDIREYFSGGFAFEYSMEWQNAIAESPFPFNKLGGSNYGVGYLSPESCDDIWTPCDYIPQPAFQNLQYAYKHANVWFDGSTLDNFTIPKDRQGRTECPKQFKPLSSFHWEADDMKDIKCPAEGKASNFQCPANLDDLRVNPEQVPLRPGLILCIKIVSFFWGSIVTCCLGMLVINAIRKRRESPVGEPTWMTVIVPNDSDSISEESAGLLSMKGWDLGGELSTTRYKSIESDLSSVGECRQQP